MDNLSAEVLKTRLRLEFVREIHPELHAMYVRVPPKLHASLTMKLLERCLTLEAVLRGQPFSSLHPGALMHAENSGISASSKTAVSEEVSTIVTNLPNENPDKALHPAESMGMALGSALDGFT